MIGAMAMETLPASSTSILRFVKMSDVGLNGGRHVADVDFIQDCTVFFTNLVTLAIVEVPTKKFSFCCTRHVKVRPLASKALVFMMSNAVFWQY